MVDAESDAAELGGLRAGTAALSAESLPEDLKDLPVESTTLGTKEEPGVRTAASSAVSTSGGGPLARTEGGPRQHAGWC